MSMNIEKNPRYIAIEAIFLANLLKEINRLDEEGWSLVTVVQNQLDGTGYSAILVWDPQENSGHE